MSPLIVVITINEYAATKRKRPVYEAPLSKSLTSESLLELGFELLLF